MGIFLFKALIPLLCNESIIYVIPRLGYPIYHPVLKALQIRGIPRILGDVPRLVEVTFVVVEFVNVVGMKDVLVWIGLEHAHRI